MVPARTAARLALLLAVAPLAGSAAGPPREKVFRPISSAAPPLAGTRVPLPRVLEVRRAALAPLLAPAVRLEPATAPGQPVVARLGGAPRLPDGLAWPTSPAHPMSFVGEVDLDALHAAAPGALPALPRSGRLAFFYDDEEQRYGGEKDDRDYHRVLLLQGGAPRAAPAGATVFKERRLGARPVRVLPDLEDLPTALVLGRAERAAYGELADAIVPGPDHRLGGHPAWIQGNDRPGPGWSLLWQVDSDDLAGFTWGDVGRLYLFARDADLAAGRFDRIKVVMQCY